MTPPESTPEASPDRSRDTAPRDTPSRDTAPRAASPRAAAQRVAARQARRSLEPEARSHAEASIASLVAALDELGRPGRIGWYHATDGEVDLVDLVPMLRRRGWQVFLPVIGMANSMSFMEWPAGGRLVPNRFGILEPAPDPGPGAVGPGAVGPAAVGPAAVGAAALDVVVVPCVAVDPSGHRLGFGAGYYDRALAEALEVTRLGVVFEVQVVERIDPARWDVPLDVVVTEERVIRPDH